MINLIAVAVFSVLLWASLIASVWFAFITIIYREEEDNVG